MGCEVLAILTLLFWASVCFFGTQFLVLILNLFTFPVIRSGSRTDEKVSILMPVRNEIDILPSTLPLLLAQPADEILILDDQSSDGSSELLVEESNSNRRLRVIKGKPLPKGWTGKNWACHQLAELAQGEIFVFTDADVFWRQGSLGAMLSFRRKQRAELLSVWPLQEVESVLERIVIPQLDVILLGCLPYLGAKHLPLNSLVAANGQMMMWTRESYRKVGGHVSVKSLVLEDVSLARLAKASGQRVVMGLGGQVLQTRMYRRPKDLIEGFAKSIVPAAGNAAVLITILMLCALSYTLSWGLFILEQRWLLVCLLGLGLRGLVDIKVGRNPIMWLWVQPIVPIVAWYIGIYALNKRGAYSWKGRNYL